MKANSDLILSGHLLSVLQPSLPPGAPAAGSGGADSAGRPGKPRAGGWGAGALSGAAFLPPFPRGSGDRLSGTHGLGFFPSGHECFERQ